MANIPLSDVKSSAMSAHGYDPESRTLHVKFKDGSVYSHSDVPLEKYAAMTGADSIGNFYNKRIKNAHPGQKLKNSK